MALLGRQQVDWAMPQVAVSFSRYLSFDFCCLLLSFSSDFWCRHPRTKGTPGKTGVMSSMHRSFGFLAAPSHSLLKTYAAAKLRPSCVGILSKSFVGISCLRAYVDAHKIHLCVYIYIYIYCIIVLYSLSTYIRYKDIRHLTKSGASLKAWPRSAYLLKWGHPEQRGPPSAECIMVQ